MRYDLKKTYDCQRAKEYLDKLIKNKSIIDLKKNHPKRTVLQNAYLHVLISLFGNHFGLLLNEAKQTIKEELGYVYEKKGRKFLVETSKMDAAELTIFIDKYRDWSNITCEYYLPTPEEYYLDQIRIDNEIENYF